MEGLFSEHIAKKVVLRGDIDNAETARVSLKNAHKVAITVSVALVSEALPLTLRQHDAASAGTSKDLVIANDYFYKLDADDVATRVSAPGTASVTEAALTNKAGYITIEVNSEDLDVDNGFDYISVVVDDLTNARIGDVQAESHMPRRKPAYEVIL